jgi:hypothetical protein
LADKDYDVAVSFLSADEPLALRLAEELQPLTTFVYSKRQEDLAGRQGDEAFRDVFLHRSRLAVVLFRPRWGQTPWTRVEESAIRDRIHTDGLNHLMFVRLEKCANPLWLSERYIHYDLEQFGLEQLVGAIKARCLDLGSQIRVLTAAERARKLADAERFAPETEQILRSTAQPMYDAAAPVFAALDRTFAEIRRTTPWMVVAQFDAREIVAAANTHSLQLQCTWSPSTSSAELALRVFEGRVLTPEERRGGHILINEPHESHEERFELARVPDLGWCWRQSSRTFTADGLAEHAAHQLLSALERGPDTSGEAIEQLFGRRR